MRVLVLSAAALVLLTGCREYVVDQAPPVQPLGDETRSAYIKGPSELALGQAVQFKAERFENARYDWRLRGPVTLESLDDGTRYHRGRAAERGASVVEVLVFGADGEFIARGEQPVRVTD